MLIMLKQASGGWVKTAKLRLFVSRQRKKRDAQHQTSTTLARQGFQSVPTGGKREKNILNGLDGCFYQTPRKGQFSLQTKVAKGKSQGKSVF